MSTASLGNTSIRKPVFWADNEDSAVSRGTDDEATGTIERMASRGYGWDSDALVWRRIKVDSNGQVATTGGAGGTQYTEGDTDASITGTAVLWEDTSDTLRVASAAKPFPVEIVAGAGSGGTAAADDADFTAGSTSGTPVMGVFESSPTSVTDGDLGVVGITAGRQLKVTEASAAAIAASLSVLDDWDESDRAKVNPIAGQAGVAAGAGAVGATVQRTVAAGVSIFRSIDLDESEEEVKGSAGTLFGVWASNLATSTRFLKIYDATAANVTVGTTTPVVTLALPGNSADDVSANLGGGYGAAFANGITVAATTGVADADTGAPGANEVLVNVFYA